MKNTDVVLPLVLVFFAWAIWATCLAYDGGPTDERWEFSIGTHERIDHWHEEP